MLPIWPGHYREEVAGGREQQPQDDSSCHAVKLSKIESKKRRVGEGNSVSTQRRLVFTPFMSAAHKPELRCKYEAERMSVSQLVKKHLDAQVSQSKSVTRWKHHMETDEGCAAQSNSNSAAAMVGAANTTAPVQHEENVTLKSHDSKHSVPKLVPSITAAMAESVDGDDLHRNSIVLDIAWRECNGNDMYMRGKALGMALSRHSNGKEAYSIGMGYPGGTTSRDPTIACLQVDKMGSLVAAGSIDGRVSVYDLDEARYLTMMRRNDKTECEEYPPSVTQRAIREFQTGRSVACVAWNPHAGRECELAVGFSYWADIHVYNLEGAHSPPPYRVLSSRRRPSASPQFMPSRNIEGRREENCGRRCMIFFHPPPGNLKIYKSEMLAAGGMEGAIDLWKGRSNNLQPSMSVPRESHRVSEGSVVGLAELGGEDKTLLLVATSRGIISLYDIAQSHNKAMTTCASLMRVGRWDLKHHDVWPGGTPSCLALLHVIDLQILGGPRVPSKTESPRRCSSVLISLRNGAMLVFDMSRKQVLSAWIPEVQQMEKPEKHHAPQAVAVHGEVHVVSSISRRSVACMDLALFRSGNKRLMETCEWASKPCTWRKITPIATSTTSEKSADISCLAGCPHTGYVLAGMTDGTVHILCE